MPFCCGGILKAQHGFHVVFSDVIKDAAPGFPVIFDGPSNSMISQSRESTHLSYFGGSDNTVFSACYLVIAL